MLFKQLSLRMFNLRRLAVDDEEVGVKVDADWLVVILLLRFLLFGVNA
jgi:hypothetical protein